VAGVGPGGGGGGGGVNHQALAMLAAASNDHSIGPSLTAVIRTKMYTSFTQHEARETRSLCMHMSGRAFIRLRQSRRPTSLQRGFTSDML